MGKTKATGLGSIENNSQWLSHIVASLGLIQVGVKALIRTFTSGKSSSYNEKR